jgi:hypothetical protein
VRPQPPGPRQHGRQASQLRNRLHLAAREPGRHRPRRPARLPRLRRPVRDASASSSPPAPTRAQPPSTPPATCCPPPAEDLDGKPRPSDVRLRVSDQILDAPPEPLQASRPDL